MSPVITVNPELVALAERIAETERLVEDVRLALRDVVQELRDVDDWRMNAATSTERPGPLAGYDGAQ